MRPAPALASLAFLLLSAEAGSAPIQPLSDSRSTLAAYEFPRAPDNSDYYVDRDRADDLAPFDSRVSVAVDIELFDPFPNAQGWAEATQVSSIGGASILAEGSVSTEVAGFRSPASADSALEILFELDAPRAYSLQGTVQAEGNAFSTVFLGKPGLSGEVFGVLQDRYNPPNQPPVPFSVSGILEPGVYTLIAQARSCSGGSSPPCGSLDELSYGRGSYAVALIFVPEPGTGLLLGLGLTAFAAARRADRGEAHRPRRAKIRPRFPGRP